MSRSSAFSMKRCMLATSSSVGEAGTGSVEGSNAPLPAISKLLRRLGIDVEIC